MLTIGTYVRTWCGTRDNKYYVYGTIVDTIYLKATDELLYQVQWDEGGFDYLGDYELEVVSHNN